MRESPQALEAWVLYRDLGPERSLAAVGQRLGKSTTLMERWCRAHGWVERARRHDQQIAEMAAERARAARLAEIEKRRQQREQVATAVRGKAAAALRLMEPEQLARKPYAVVQMFQYADESERLDMGEATQRTALQGADGGAIVVQQKRDLSPLSDEELDDLERLISRLADAGGDTP